MHAILVTDNVRRVWFFYFLFLVLIKIENIFKNVFVLNFKNIFNKNILKKRLKIKIYRF